MRVHLAVTLGSVTMAAALAGCTGFYPVAVATRVPAALDMAPYSCVLVAGFVGAGVDDVDTSAETVRLLRSQLRAARSLTIVNAGEMPLTHTALGDAAFWRRVGEEYQDPLIVTGSIVLSSQTRTADQLREREAFDAEGRRRVETIRTITDVETRTLTARLVYIDGRTGNAVHIDTFREETSHAATQSVPALSSYFELMARVVPVVFGTLSDHQIVGPRTLLK